MQTTRSHPPCRSRASLTLRSTLSVRPRRSAKAWPRAIATASRSTPSPMASGSLSSTRSSSSAHPQPMSRTVPGLPSARNATSRPARSSESGVMKVRSACGGVKSGLTRSSSRRGSRVWQRSRAPYPRGYGGPVMSARWQASSFAAAARSEPSRTPSLRSRARDRPPTPDHSRTHHPARTHMTITSAAAQRDAVPALPRLPADRPARPHLADADDHRGAALALDRPARRQPGADRPDDPGPQDEDVRAAGPDGLQGDRGRLPGGQRDRLRLRPPADRERPDPRRRHDLGADPGPRGPDRAHRAVAGRRTTAPTSTSTTRWRRCSAGSSSTPARTRSRTSRSAAPSW